LEKKESSRLSEATEKPIVVKLDKDQLRDLFVLIDHYITKEITEKLKSIDERLGKLERAITKVEGELKLIRVELSALKGKEN
jgi:chromosome segregation ATPase